jgi:hypothetical protein
MIGWHVVVGGINHSGFARWQNRLGIEVGDRRLQLGQLLCFADGCDCRGSNAKKWDEWSRIIRVAYIAVSDFFKR